MPSRVTQTLRKTEEFVRKLQLGISRGNSAPKDDLWGNFQKFFIQGNMPARRQQTAILQSSTIFLIIHFVNEDVMCPASLSAVSFQHFFARRDSSQTAV